MRGSGPRRNPEMALLKAFGPGRVAAPGAHADRPSIKLPLLLTSPTLLVVFVIFGIPLVYALALSMHRINMLTQQWIFVGLDNYIDILPDPEFIAALGRTAYFAIVTVSGGLLLGMGMALVLNMVFPTRNFLRSVVLVPGDGAGRRGCALGMDVEWRVRHLQRNPVRSRPDREADPLARRRHRRLHLVALVHVWNQRAARRAADPGGPAVDAGQPAPRGAHRRRRPLPALLQDHAALAQADAAAHHDPDHDQLGSWPSICSGS